MRTLNFLCRLIFLFCFPLSSTGQTVSTLISDIGASDVEAITFHPDGWLYSPSFGDGILHKIDMNGNHTSIITGLKGPLGGAVDQQGNFYFSEFNTNKIFIVRPDDSYNEFASGFAGPTGIVLGPNGDSLFITDGNPGRVRILDLKAISAYRPTSVPIARLRLAQASPNPTTGDLLLSVELPQAAAVSLSLWDLQGREVAHLQHGWTAAGTHELRWKCPPGMAAGQYRLVLQADGLRDSMPIILHN